MVIDRVVPALLVAIVLAGCGSSKDADDRKATTVTTATASQTTSTATASVGDLSDVVITEVPLPYEIAPRTIPQGPFDLESFLDNFSTAEEEDRKVLTACGLKRGFSRPWFDETTGRILAIFVYECSSGAAATALRDGFEDLDRRLKDAKAFDIPSIPGARGETYLEDVEDSKARIDMVTFVRGPRLYVNAVQSESLEGHSDLALDLAQREAVVAR